ncbi:MAG: hypothetical protein SGPRY_008237 [Prymnesium sp.]
MGAYLSAPKLEKHSQADSSLLGHKYGVSSMQGWRRTQEDAHLVVDIPGPPCTSVYGVFDGHGGREVSSFAALHFVQVLVSTTTFATNLVSAMAPAFHGIDALLNDPQYLEELRSLKVSAQNKGDADGSGNTAGDGDGSGGGRKIPVEEAVDLFQKMMLFKKMQQEAKNSAGAQQRLSRAGSSSEDSCAVSYVSNAPRVCTLPPSHVEAGCTAIVACVRGQQLVIANAGDSRAVLCRAGNAVPLSEDHKPSLQSESQRIQQAGGWITVQGRINGNLNLSRALGDLKYKGNSSVPASAQIISAEPEVRSHTLTADDEFLVLACDGIWDCMVRICPSSNNGFTNQEVCDFVRERIASTPLDKIAEQMFDHCISEDPKVTQGIGGDNMTALIVAFR